jgi:heme-degrading monooxygenase HmoA
VAATQPRAAAAAEGVGTLDVLTIEYQSTPFRAERFLEMYEPAIARVLAYGAKGYLFYRSVDDPDHFVHVSYWEERQDFDRYWLSREMREIRKRVSGLHNLPVLPHWNYLITRG